MQLADFRAAIFYLDGTLVESEPAWELAKTRVATRHGRIAAPEVLAAHVGRGLDAFVHEVFGPVLTTDSHAAVSAEILAEAAHLLPKMRAPIEGAVEMVHVLHQRGLRLAICSSSSRHHIDDALALLGLTDEFEVIVSAADLPRGKPDPLPFQTAVDALRLNPSQVFAVEDSWPGVQSAVSAGLYTVAVGQGCTHPKFGICQIRAENYATLWPQIDGLAS